MLNSVAASDAAADKKKRRRIWGRLITFCKPGKKTGGIRNVRNSDRSALSAGGARMGGESQKTPRASTRKQAAEMPHSSH